MSYWYAIGDVVVSVWALYVRASKLSVAASLGAIASKVGTLEATTFLDRLRSIPEIGTYLANVNPSSDYPNIPVTGIFTKPEVLQGFLGSVDELTGNS
jgi:hypothetical protein